jgi:AP-3 complex subunit beta
MRGDHHLPFWLEQGIESSLRDTEEDIPVISFTAMSSVQAQRSLGSLQIASPAVLTPTEGTPPGGGGGGGGIQGGSKGPWMDLDKFYESDDSEEDDSENSNEEQDDNVEHEDEEEEDDGDEEEDEEDEEEERKGEDPRHG